MKIKLLTVVILYCLWTIVQCQSHDGSAIHLINSLNDFYRFDHLILLADSSIDLNQFISLNGGIQLTPQTIYTFDNRSEQTTLHAITSRNTLLIVVIDSVTFEHEPKSLALIKSMRKPYDVDIKIGVFFTQHMTSLNVTEQLFRWSWTVGIVNIFSAFHFGDSFSVFKYDPFGTFHLINMTGDYSIRDYFSDTIPNYRHHPLRVIRISKHHNTILEMNFWDTVRIAFNASASWIFLSYAEYTQYRLQNGDVFLHENFVTMGLYPYRQIILMTIVPHAQPYTDFVAYLQNLTWTLLFVYIFIVIVASSLLLFISGYLHQRKMLCLQCAVDVINVLLNDNTAIRYRSFNRSDICIVVPLTFTGLIVMNGIVSLLQSYLTSPIYQRQINSIDDLYRSSVPILTNEVELKDRMIKLLKELSQHDGWDHKVHGMNIYQLAEEARTFNNSIAFFMNNHQAKALLDVQDRLHLKAYHLISDTFFAKYLVSYEVRSDFPFIEPISDIIHRLNGAGLIDKWIKEDNDRDVQSVWRINRDRHIESSNDSDVTEFTGMTVVWYGWIASAIIFASELIWNKIKSSRLLRKLGKNLSFFSFMQRNGSQMSGK